MVEAGEEVNACVYPSTACIPAALSVSRLITLYLLINTQCHVVLISSVYKLADLINL